MQHPPAKPRWAKWQSIPVVDLWQGVALTMGFEPDDTHNLNWRPSGSPEFDVGIVFKDRLEVAESNVQYEELRNALAQRQVGVPEYAKVKLPAFSAWALSLNWEMPTEMVEIAQRASEPPHPAAATVAVPRELKTRERETVLKLIIGMATKGYGFDPRNERNSATQEITNDLSELGLSLDVDTVRKWLRESAELLNQRDA